MRSNMENHEALIFNEDDFWEFVGKYDPTDFFRALGLILDNKFIIYIETSSIDEDILKRLSAYEVDENQRKKIHPGTIWPKGKKLHLKCENGSIERLIEISNKHAVPEYADHVVVYGEKIIISAYGFTEDNFYVTKDFGLQLIQKFSDMIGVNYQ